MTVRGMPASERHLHIKMKKIKRRVCVVMPLVLMYKWYDMINKDGGKREEYRDDTQRYRRRFYNFIDRTECIFGDDYKKKVVAFSRAYTKPDMFWLCDLEFRTAGECLHPEWGEPKDKAHWVIHLLERVQLVD